MNGRKPGDPDDEPAPDVSELDFSVLEIPILTEVLEIPVLTEVLEPPATPLPVAPAPEDPEPDQSP